MECPAQTDATMARSKKKTGKQSRRKQQPRKRSKQKPLPSPGATYEQAFQLAIGGRHSEADLLYERITSQECDPHLQALVRNDRAALAAARGDQVAARAELALALQLDQNCAQAQYNLAMLGASDAASASTQRPDSSAVPTVRPATVAGSEFPVRVAVVSFLFNWPSTGGGIVHTVELCHFLQKAGYEVRHIFARFDPWGIGQVGQPLPFRSECLHFTERDWNLENILFRFRQAVDAIGPDYVIVTDSWNIKPLLADVLRGHRVILRFQALECLCPLNNVRLLIESSGRAEQCPFHQLDTPGECERCLAERGRQSGALHQAERDLCRVGTPTYQATLLRALSEAEAVLVLNPLIEALMSPYAPKVRVVTWGMDPDRFPSTVPASAAGAARPLTLFQAGMIAEYSKGYHVLHAACERLWKRRQDFRLVATGEPADQVDAFTHFTGWISQEDLPRQYAVADIVVVPAVAQEGLSRTSVEAMAAGRPVIASRIGGLPFTVADGVTGLLCRPDDEADLARTIERLLDNPELRFRMGEEGRRRFEEHFTWPGVIERYYRPLLRPTAGVVRRGIAT
jgi:glycosyltransferase involved in cell wall biosynthesis